MRPMRIAWLLFAILALALILHPLFVRDARGQEKPGAVMFDCQSLAGVVSRGVTYRDAGANVGRTVQLFLRKLQPPSKGHATVLEREIRRMWRERLDEDDAGFSTFKRCVENNGEMGVGLEG